MKLLWTDDFVFFLINKVQAAEYVWNSQIPTFKNKLLKQKFWNSVTEQLNLHFRPQIKFESAEVIRKWNNLKSYYMMEQQKILRAQQSGATAEDIEMACVSWKFHQAMDFLTMTPASTLSANCDNKTSLHCSSEPASNLNIGAGSSPSSATSSQHIKISAIQSGQLSRITVLSPTQLTSSHLHQTPALPQSILGQSSDLHPSHLRQIPSPFSSPPSSPLAETPTKNSNSNNSKHPRKKQKTSIDNQTIATHLVHLSTTLTQALTKQMSDNASKVNNGNSTFGDCISAELNGLDEDLQIAGKRQIFNIVMDLQQQQFKRNAGGSTPNTRFE